MNNRSAAAAVLALALTSSVAWGGPAAAPEGRWEELRGSRRGPMAVAGATWFEPPPATFLRIEAAERPTLWRVTLDEATGVAALVEQPPVPVGDGVWAAWVPPSPAAPHAVVVSGTVRAFSLGAYQGARGASPAPGSATLPGGWLWRGREPLADGEPLAFEVRGPGLLRLTVQPTTPAGVLGGVTPFDLVVADGTGQPLARLPTSARVVAVPGGEPVSATRSLDLSLGPDQGDFQARVEGSDGRLYGRLYRPRCFLFRRSSGADIGGEGPGAPTLRALAAGDYQTASSHLARWLQGSPDDGEALGALATIQSREAPVPGLLPPALPALEAAVIARDTRGPEVADDDLRDAARHAWLQTSAFSTRGVEPPGDAHVLVEPLPEGDPILSLADEDRRRAGIYHVLRADHPVEVDVPGHPGAVDRWGVLRWLGINVSGQPAVAALVVDGGAPLRVLLQDTTTPFRVALPPGSHQLELRCPDGAEGTIAVAVDRRPTQGGEALRIRQAVTVGPDQGAARFGLPGAVDGIEELGLGGAPIHLRLDAWWRGDDPLSLRVEALDGIRRVTLYPAATTAVLASGPGNQPPVELAAGGAAIDLTDGTGWIRVIGDSPAWLRVRLRQPIHRTLPTASPPSTASLTTARNANLAELSRRILLGEDDDAEAVDRLLRAEWLLDAAMEDYARRDIVAARRLAGTSPPVLAALAEMDRFSRELAGPDHVVVHSLRGGIPLPLDLPASAGEGPPAWLDALARDDPAVLLAEGRLAELAAAVPGMPAPRRALAARALAAAETDPDRALAALLHGVAVREIVEDATAARIVSTARSVTRADPLLAADRSADRVFLTSPAAPPDRLSDPAAWIRWTMLGAGMERVDRILAGGTRWVLADIAGAPDELRLAAVCDDLRETAPGTPETCQLSVEDHTGRPLTWEIPRGELAVRSLERGDGIALSIALSDGGSARYAALALSGADGSWRVPDRRAAYHVARPGEPVSYTLAGPTRLRVEVAGRLRTGRPLPGAEIAVDGDLCAVLGGDGVPVTAPNTSDQGADFGPVQRVDLSVEGDGIHRVEVRSAGGAAAVRVTRRMAGEKVLPAILEENTGIAADPSTSVPRDPAAAGTVPLPSTAGTVEIRAMFWDRWSVDFEPVDERDVYLETAILHRVRAAEGLWLRGGVFGRIRFASSPSLGGRLGIHQRFPGVGLRWSGQLTVLVQRTPAGILGALAVRGRLDRPLRLGRRVLLVPHLDIRGHAQPDADLDAVAGEADLELSSRHRREHPFGLGAGLEFLWRPWADAELLLSWRARSNPDPSSLDSTGGGLELRAFPRPVGAALRFDLSRRLRDAHREEPWWRAELSLDLWADLGPARTWIRPEVRLAYLFDPTRLEVTAGLAVLPGRRALDHVAPPELHFEDVRGPAWLDGRWRR